ncbi:TetR/AcrR family transcriptional regulator C-terminal domain-containing protein [Streptomyces sp. NPDC054842]
MGTGETPGEPSTADGPGAPEGGGGVRAADGPAAPEGPDGVPEADDPAAPEGPGQESSADGLASTGVPRAPLPGGPDVKNPAAGGHPADVGGASDAYVPADGTRPAGDDWARALHRIALAAHRVALRHPHVVPLLATRLLSTPLARRPAAVLRSDERVLALLHEAGFDEDRTVALHRAFTAWLLGYLLVELRAMDDDPAEPDPAFRLGLHRISAQELPRLRAVAVRLAERGGPSGLAAGLDALLDRFR